MKEKNSRFISIVIILVLLIVQFATPHVARAAATIYVEPGGLTTGSCNNWGTACELQYALSIAIPGDEIWVQQGTYKPTTGTDRNETFVLIDDVTLYGGFVGTETLLTQRNWTANPTILSGDIGTVSDASDNVYNVVTGFNLSSLTILDGFTITEGNSNGSSGLGGGMYLEDSSPLLVNLIISNNSASSNGGGVFITTVDNTLPEVSYSRPSFTDVTINNNSAARGGGLYTQNSSPTLTRVIFIGNSATGGAGGGMNNQVLDELTDAPSIPVLNDVVFSNNTANGGGGLFNTYANSILNNVTFENNTANRRGGAVLNEYASPSFTNVTFYGNISNESVGSAPWGGGAVMNVDSDPSFNNVTFSGNNSLNGSGTAGGDAIRNTVNSNPVITNSILWGDIDDEINSDGTGSTTISYSVVEGGFVGGTNIITTDPLLTALADNGGFTQTMAVVTGSSAINAGNNGTCAPTDQRGVNRPQGSSCDIGAYEFDLGGNFTDTSVADFNGGTLGACTINAGVGDGALELNIPSSTSCVFESRIFDATEPVDWVNITYNSSTPAGTSLVFDARSGNSSSPDISWTNWQSVIGNFTNPGSRYVQYRATLSTTDSGLTPTLQDITINYIFGSVSSLTSPSGSMSTWDNSFTWTGVNGATWYLLEVYTPGMTQLHRKWYTATETGCPSSTSCSIAPSDLTLSNGDYQWRVLDYGAYGYGIWPVFESFTLGAACYTLLTNLNPAASGSVTAPTQSCAGGYTAGSVIQLTAVSGTGYVFNNWSGDASGSSNPVTVTMDGNKTITANMRGNTPLSPSGTLNNWNYTFSWTGLSNATWYLIEVQTSGGSQVFRKWYTSSQTGCSGGTACSVTATGLSLANGDYKWRVMDYGAYGYGLNSAFNNFTLSGVACYTLTTNVTPGASGYVTAPAQTCGGGYTAGSIIQISAVPNTGYLFNNWSGDAAGTANPVSVTMNSNKNVTANFKASVVLISPSGTLGSWNNTFSWTGLSNATWYLLEVYTADGTTQVFRKWYTSSQTGCSGGTSCLIIPAGTAGLANGNYKWRILDYGGYGYGTWTEYMNFTLSQ